MTSLTTRLTAATSRSGVAHVLQQHLRDILETDAMFVFLLEDDRRMVVAGEPISAQVPPLSADLPWLEALATDGRCRWVTTPGASSGDATDPLPAELSEACSGMPGPVCLAAIPDRSRRPVGLLVMGGRVAEPPFSEREVEDVLAAAGEAGRALEVVHLAERLAERLDAERRGDREIAIAREVQGKLFPQAAPHTNTLELAARCIQARSVGGDYYDFLDLGKDKVGFVLADVSGKGIHAALRMANLQAHVRSQAGSAPDDPLRVLRQVNRMLCESTQPGHFATLFLGVYNDATRRLTYINCGHNPPLCLRRGGGVERLEATATVLGAFEDWACALGRLQLSPGDRLVAYSDGVTEAMRGTEIFGEERLVEVLARRVGATAEELVSAVLAEVQAFGRGDWTDDLTLVVAKVR